MAVDLNYVTEGPEDGATVVLGESLGSTLEMWAPQVAPLVAAGYRVLRYDHRGHGGSPVPDGPYDIAGLGGDLLALLDRLGVGRVHLGGLSLGGMVGMWFAAHHPDRVASLALCCTSARPGNPAMWSERAATVRSHGCEPIADAAVARWCTEPWRRANPERVAWLRAMVAGTPAEGYAACCDALDGLDLTARLPDIAVPTLVASGEQDEALPPEHGRLIAAGIFDSYFALVPDAAHLGTVEQPDRFTELLLDHLSHAEKG